MPSSSDQVTRLLHDWKNGDPDALNRLTPLIYQELRRLAESYLRNERAARTLQPTALVHDVYLRLVGSELPDWQSRAHFFGIAAHRMRQILVEHARRRRASKRGGGTELVPFDEMVCFAPQRSSDIIALDEALNSLATFDERKCKIIELRYFAGLSMEEVGEALEISVATVGREQRLAEAWLKRYMTYGINM
jgi:RNA polymerase sigma-70 factor (ECF subfamily)